MSDVMNTGFHEKSYQDIGSKLKTVSRQSRAAAVVKSKQSTENLQVHFLNH